MSAADAASSLWIALFCTLLPCLCAVEQRARAGEGSRTSRLGISIPMRDGKSLAADVLLPAPEGEFPTVFIHTPYNRQYGDTPLPDELLARELLDRDHYAYVIVDWRGFFGSKAAAKGVGKLDHGRDGHDVVEWIARQPWSNGKVGTWGISAVGAVQYRTAIEQPEHLTCIVPASANIGFPYEQFYYGGVPQLYYLKVMETAGHEVGKLVRDHPVNGEFWRAMDGTFDRGRIDLPALFVTGWFDTHPHLKIDTYRQIRAKGKRHYDDMKLIIGPWLHTRIGKPEQGALSFPEAEDYVARQTLKFYDFWLRGDKDSGWRAMPTVQYFQMGSNEWKMADDWPPPTKTLLYYLRSGRRLDREPPHREGHDTYVSDPADPTPTVGGNLIELARARMKVPIGPQDLSKRVERRKDVLSFTTDVLSNDLEVAGSVKVKLYASSDCDDTDFAVRLSEVYPDGRSMLVADGIQRLRFCGSLEDPQLREAGEIHEVTVTLPPTAQTFLANHRLRISVSSSNYPQYEVNPNIGRRRLFGPKKRVATNRIYHDEAHPSAVLLPVAGDERERKKQ